MRPVFAYRPGRSASHVHEELVRTLKVAETASGTALLWFADVLERHLYRRRGHASVHGYARDELGFSRAKAEQFVHLARLVIRFPRLRRSLAAQRLTWTQVRTVAPVLTESSEAHWVARAERCTRRELAAEIQHARDQARRATFAPDQTALEPDPSGSAPGIAGSRSPEPDPRPPNQCRSTDPEALRAEPPGADHSPRARRPGTIECPGSTPGPEVMTSFSLRLRAVDRARVERLFEVVQRSGHPGGRAEILLAALERLAAGAQAGRQATDGSPRKATRPAYQVIVSVCPRCRRGATPTPGGSHVLDEVTVDTLLCDADLVTGKGHRRSVIPPAARRRVLARDGHRCVTPGCGATQFLEIHHRIPVSHGGTNAPENLVTLCHRCHRSIHAMAAERGVSGVTTPPPGPDTAPGVPSPSGPVPPSSSGRDGRVAARGDGPDPRIPAGRGPPAPVDRRVSPAVAPARR